FSVYATVALLMGARPVEVDLAPSGGMDLEAMAEAATSRETGPARMVFLARPNNPTGGVFDPDDFDRFLPRVDPGTLVVLDEAYREFDPSPFDARKWIAGHPNLVVTRTFSKIYGLAGLRLGYGIGDPRIWRPLYTARDPFSINLPAQAAGIAALADHEHVQ